MRYLGQQSDTETIVQLIAKSKREKIIDNLIDNYFKSIEIIN